MEIEVRGNELKINARDWSSFTTIEDSKEMMKFVIEKLIEIPEIERVTISEYREIEYSEEQVKILKEIANIYNFFVKEKGVLSLDFFPHYNRTTKELMSLLLSDPILCYIKVSILVFKNPEAPYTKEFLLPLKEMLEKSRLIGEVKEKLDRYTPGSRELYRSIFIPTMRPIFMLSRFFLFPPKGSELVEKYYLKNGSEVDIYKVPNKVRLLYFIFSKEFSLSEEKYSLLNEARAILMERKMEEKELRDLESVRKVFLERGKAILKDLVISKRVPVSPKEIEELAEILVRYTAGFGILEILLADDRIQDIYVNAPSGISPVFVNHADYGECETNLIVTPEEAEAWATRFRLYSGRPLDEANPVLDTEITLPVGRARVAAVTRTLSSAGLGFAFRRHRESPWTFPLFIKVKYFNPLFAGLMSFIIDGGRAVLVAGGRGSGKTSLLSAMILELMRRYRIIIQEDSVDGSSRIIYLRNGKLEKSTVGKLIDTLMKKYGSENEDGREVLKKNPERIMVFSLNKDYKVVPSLVTRFIRHKVKKRMYEIITRTGKRIKVTEDHSLFSLVNKKVLPVKPTQLKPGDYIVTPRILPLVFNKKTEKINLLNILPLDQEYYIFGKNLRKIIISQKEKLKKLANDEGYYVKSAVAHWRKKGILPLKIFRKLRVPLKDCKDCYIKSRAGGKPLPLWIKLDETLLTFFGLWLADGCYDGGNVIISVVDEESRKIVRKVAEKFSLNTRMHSDGFSLIIGSQILSLMMKNLGFTGDAYTKKVPDFIYSLSPKEIAAFLRGIFSGDGYVGKNEVGISLCSSQLIKDIQTLLLFFGVVSRVGKRKSSDKTYSLRISDTKFLKKFLKIGFLQKEKNEKLHQLAKRKSTHDNTDIIPLSLEIKNVLSSKKLIDKHDYIIRGNNIGRSKLQKICKLINDKDIKKLAYSDIFWDEVKNIKCLGIQEKFVYDFSVPGCENFICENILAHNTPEIPVEIYRKLGYNVLHLKSRSVITHVETELAPEEALRTALRLGDSALIVGEVRSKESTVLFEAMRIGALANLVAGTIHGESAYGVYDRVVHDLGLVPTSFKALDIIVIANVITSPDGLRRFRRVTEVVEIRKKWKEDPMLEGAFVPLMTYSAKEDTLKPTDVLLNGESEVLNEIAKRVREWHGAWDRVWDNILLRAKIKQTMVEFAEKLNKPEILEAEWVVNANEAFHLISEEVSREVGYVDSKIVYEKWLDWFKRRVKW